MIKLVYIFIVSTWYGDLFVYNYPIKQVNYFLLLFIKLKIILQLFNKYLKHLFYQINFFSKLNDLNIFVVLTFNWKWFCYI